jgi:NAD-reducing hydrogenase large subunit
LQLYDGVLRFKDAAGKLVTECQPCHYGDSIGEAAVPDSYLKAPYYKPLGYPDGIYRVGPLARLNAADSLGTPEAEVEFQEFQQRCGRPAQSSLHYHYARLVETIYALERMEMLLDDPQILATHVRAHAGVNAPEGVGMIEAPRGTLIHHYKVDDDGAMLWANLIVATGHNNMAISQGVEQVAKHFVNGARLEEGMLNRVQALVRCYDPCLSCSTHALGQMPVEIRLLAPDGTTLDTLRS